MEDNFKIVYEPPRKRIIDSIYFDLRIVRNSMTDLQCQINKQPEYGKSEHDVELLAAWGQFEDYLLMKLAEEKKIFRASEN